MGVVVSCGRVVVVFVVKVGKSGIKLAKLTQNCSEMEKEIKEMDASIIQEMIPSFVQSSCTDKSS